MNKTYSPSIILCHLICLLTPFFLFQGCTLLQVREEANTLQKSTVLAGIVSSTFSNGDIPVVVAAYSKTDDIRKIIHYTTLHEPGPYELMVPSGTHNIIAFGDRNKNLIYDSGEPVGQILSAEQVSTPVGGVSGNLDIVITEKDNDKIDLPVGFEMPSKGYKGFHSTCPGAIADLDDVIFSDEYGKKGFWSSLEFFREIGGNVYFLEDYDPDKIPVLFVHGAGGSPQNWRAFFKNIDRTKYQPWFFYYPSGSSLDSMSYLLFWKLGNLQTKYKFKELYIVAHSMGGLIVRSFMVNYGHLFPSITSFISVSTPWGGEELAELGVKYSPGVIPAWRDMQPESEFIKSIFSKKIPPGVDHYLFFGHKGNRNILRPNNDNVVTLASQLDRRSQKDARMIYGFNEDHMSILSSKQVISQFNAILADIYQKSETPNSIRGNRLRVDFSFEFPEDQPRPTANLYLHPVDKKGSETWIYLNPEDSGQEHGPFTPGDYEVSIIAPAFVPDSIRIPVTIKEGSVPKVRFSLKPAGYIRGFVAVNDQTYLQAGEERLPDSKVEIESVILKGNGVRRSLIPLHEERNYSEILPEYYLSGTDFTTQGTFYFFNLPGGKYELTVNAKGYEPYSKTYDVKPGQYQDTIIIELVKEKAE